MSVHLYAVTGQSLLGCLYHIFTQLNPQMCCMTTYTGVIHLFSTTKIPSKEEFFKRVKKHLRFVSFKKKKVKGNAGRMLKQKKQCGILFCGHANCNKPQLQQSLDLASKAEKPLALYLVHLFCHYR